MFKKNPILKFEIISTIIIMILGTILHFSYEWSNYNKFIGIFSATNESVWEHLKLLFYPMLLMIIVGYIYKGKEIPNYLCAKTIGIIIALSFTIVLHYTYSGIIGKDIAPIDIGTFFVAVLIGEYISYREMKKEKDCNKTIAITILVLLFLCFTIFTFWQPKINLFKDPQTSQYGLFFLR